MPVVSHSVMRCTPRSAKRSIQSSTCEVDTGPSIGQPKAQDSDTFTAVPSCCASVTTSASVRNDCCCVMRRLARLCVALADITRLNSSARPSMARSAPRALGTSAVYSMPGVRWMRRITSSASRSAGMALGAVNEVTSILA